MIFSCSNWFFCICCIVFWFIFWYYRRNIFLEDCKIPVLYKMVSNICNNLSSYFECYIVPRHSWKAPVLQISIIFTHLNKVFYANIVVVNSRIHLFVIFVYGVVFCIESTIAQVKSTHERHFLIYNNCFFVMTP